MSDQHPLPPLTRLSFIAAGLVAAGMLACLCVPALRPSRSTPPAPTPSTRTIDSNAPSSGSAAGAAAADLQAGLSSAWRSLRASPGAVAGKAALDDLRRALHGVSSARATEAITRFLATNADAPTGQPFKLGPGGALEGSPTLRTFLLEQLAQIDPAAAAANARAILASMDSSDEWAIALRNLVRGDTSADSRRFAAGKLQAMLNHPAWQQDPSVGFLESFDVAVHLRAPELFSTLTGLVRLKENPAVAHAAYLALDRLTINDPTTTLAALQAGPDAMTGREVTRANYFARADVRDDAQRVLLETYLLSPALGPEELDKFSALYPNANFMISHNLLTETATPNHDWLAGRDREALQVVKRWQTDERFARVRPQLQAIEQRLQQFVLQARRN